MTMTSLERTAKADWVSLRSHPLLGRWPGETPAHRRRRRLGRTFAIAACALVLGLVAAALYHPPVAVVAPGRATDISNDVTISGVPAHAPRGVYLMLTVRTERPSLLGLAGAVMHGNRRLLHPTNKAPDPTTANRLSTEFTQSRLDAAAAAAKAAGLRVGPGGALPFTVRFRSRHVVGPSAGLVYALLIDDMLSPTGGVGAKTVAATGGINANGDITDVGYVSEKAEEAEGGPAEYLVIPENQTDQASGRAVIVAGVASLEEALHLLSGPQS